MEQPAAYIPMDRRQALALHKPLSGRTTGAALFADISGFTGLTEALARELGPQRGAEELTGHLNRVYDALISELHRFGGSVISFAGDAIICWLDGDDGRRAVTCALAMQMTIAQFASLKISTKTTMSLTLKTAVAVGAVRRFVVGDEDIQLMDVLAGETLEQLVEAGELAGKGEVIIPSSAADALADFISVRDWRSHIQSGQQFAVVAEIKEAVSPAPWPEIPVNALKEVNIESWLLPTVYDQLRYGRGEFLAELRPAIALFLQFQGLDYDRDEEADEKLNAFIQHVQRIITDYEGALLQVTIGDKGSYLYAAFGAPIAHEDDAARAVASAWELVNSVTNFPGIRDLKIGIASGGMRTGAYGGAMRRTYGVLGDSVNLSARLMEKAQTGQIMATLEIQQATAITFNWEILPAIQVKGKTESIVVATVKSVRQRTMLRLLEPNYALPMVGREEELAFVAGKLELARQGQGQIVGLTADAGMGKSRLIAEIIRLAKEQVMEGYGGECQSFGTKTSYQVWFTIWRAFFNVIGDLTEDEYVNRLEMELERIDPGLLPRLPLLSAVLNLSIPDNDLTGSFDAKLRKSSLESLLVTCVRARAAERPLLFVFEDSHWLDPISHDLVEIIGRAIIDLPVMMILAYRPVEIGNDTPPRVSQLPYFSEITLTEFTTEQAEQLIRLKLMQLFDAETAVDPLFVQKITTRADGNPFYIEELLNYLQDRKIDPQQFVRLERLDLPDSLHSLILSRIDQLTEAQKSTLKIASVIGRLFQVTLLWGVYPELGDFNQIQSDLNALSQLELTLLDTPEPELAYIFKHVVTHEATYDSLPYATRARLHTQIGEYIERAYADSLTTYISILAHHFEHGENEAKKRKYLMLAAEEARKKYAHEAAIAYYERVLPMLPESEKVQVMLSQGEALQTIGRWSEAEKLLNEALNLANTLDDLHGRAYCLSALADLLRMQGKFDDAAAHLMRARLDFQNLGDDAGVGQVLKSTGTLVAQQGDYEQARSLWEESLVIYRRLGDETNIANLINNLGIIARFQGDLESAQALYEESLAIRQKLGNKMSIYVSLSNLGLFALNQGDLAMASQRLDAANVLAREVGDRWALANSLNNLANAMRDQGDFKKAHDLYHESLQINRELGDKRALAFVLEDLGCLVAAEGEAVSALKLAAAAATVREEIGAPLAPNDQQKLDDSLALARETLIENEQVQAIETGRKMSLDEAVAYALRL